MTAQRFEKITLSQPAAKSAKFLRLGLLLAGVGLLVGLLVAKQMTLLALVFAAAVVMFAIVARPDTATLLAVFLIFSNLVVLGVRFHGLPAIASTLVPGLLLPPLFYHLVICREKLVLVKSLPWVMLFMAVIMISTIVSSDFTTAFDELMTYLTEGLALFLLITNVVRTSKQLRLVIWALLASGILMGAVPLYQQVTGTYSNNYGGLAQVSDATFSTGTEDLQGDVRQPRLAGALGEMNRFAQVMLMLIPLGFFRFWGERSRLLRLLALIATGLAGLGMVLAFSRGAAIAFVLMLLLMVFFRVVKPVQLGGFILVAGLLLAVFPQYSERLLSIQSVTGFIKGQSTGSEATTPDGAITGRLTEMLAAARVYADHPIIGVGPGMFKYYSRQYSRDLGLRNLIGDREAHSLYLGIAAETGSLGLFCFLGMLAVTFLELLRVRGLSRGVRPDLENLVTCFIVALVAYLTAGIFLHLSYMRYFWLMFALASVASTIALKELAEPAPEQASIVELKGRII